MAYILYWIGPNIYNYHVVFGWGNLLIEIPREYLNDRFDEATYTLLNSKLMGDRISRIIADADEKTYREYKDFEELIYFQILSGILGRK